MCLSFFTETEVKVVARVAWYAKGGLLLHQGVRRLLVLGLLHPREVYCDPELLQLLPRVLGVVAGDHLCVEVVPVQRVSGRPRVLHRVELDERDVVVHLRPPQPPRDEPRERLEQRHDLLLPDLRRDVADEELRRRRVLRHHTPLRQPSLEPRGGPAAERQYGGGALRPLQQLG